MMRENLKTGPKPKILLVDDDREMRTFLSEEFSDRNYTVTEAVDSKDAIEKMFLSEFDLILTDIKMPRLGGLELLAHTRRCFPQIPVILMTAFGGEILIKIANREGAYACILKPIVLKELHDIVMKALDEKEGTR